MAPLVAAMAQHPFAFGGAEHDRTLAKLPASITAC